MKFSIRALLILIVTAFVLLVFHELAFEILIRGYWPIVAIVFVSRIWMTRKASSRSILIPLTILIPSILVFVYASSARKIIVDPENAGKLFKLPGLESLLDQILAFWCHFHGDALPGLIHFEMGLMETLLTVVIIGILGSAALGVMVGRIVAQNRRITNG